MHRDLKTANLMRDRSGIVRVMDFGIAKHHGEAESGVTVTATGTLMGTPEYMSPEQLRGDEVDFRSDLYSLAIVIYELFTGALPFRGDSPVATIVRQLQEPPALDAAALPEALRPVLLRALAKDAGASATRPRPRCARRSRRRAPPRVRPAWSAHAGSAAAPPPRRRATSADGRRRSACPWCASGSPGSACSPWRRTCWAPAAWCRCLRRRRPACRRAPPRRQTRRCPRGRPPVSALPRPRPLAHGDVCALAPTGAPRPVRRRLAWIYDAGEVDVAPRRV